MSSLIIRLLILLTMTICIIYTQGRDFEIIHYWIFHDLFVPIEPNSWISDHIGWVTIVGDSHILFLNPIPCNGSWTYFLDSPVGRGFASFFFFLFFSTVQTPKAITTLCLLVVLCLNHMCLCFPLYNSLFVTPFIK